MHSTFPSRSTRTPTTIPTALPICGSISAAAIDRDSKWRSRCLGPPRQDLGFAPTAPQIVRFQRRGHEAVLRDDNLNASDRSIAGRSILQDLAAGRHAPQAAFQPLEFDPGIPQESTDGVAAVVILNAERNGDAVLPDELGIFLGPEVRRTAHLTAAASTRPDARRASGRVEEQGFPLGRGLLARSVQVEEPREFHPARFAGLRLDLLLVLGERRRSQRLRRLGCPGPRGPPADAAQQQEQGRGGS